MVLYRSLQATDADQVMPERDDTTNFAHAATDGPRSVRGSTCARIRWAVEIRDEDNTADGWVWEIRLHPSDATGAAETALPEPLNLKASLSWVDHDHLCHGRLAPSEVIARIVRHAVAHMPAHVLPSRFDASQLGRIMTRLGGVDRDAADLGRLFQREC